MSDLIVLLAIAFLVAVPFGLVHLLVGFSDEMQ